MRRSLTALRHLVATLLLLVLVGPVVGGWLGGWQLLVVDGGSMAPAIVWGDVIVVDTNTGTDLPVGEVVTVRRPTGVLYTHRIVDVGADGEVTTQGDANPIPDSPAVSRADILGVLAIHVAQPWAPVIAASQSLLGRLSLGVVLIGILVVPAATRTRR